MTEYWNAELETRAWREVEAWQAGRISKVLQPLRARSQMYAELHADVPQATFDRFEDLRSLPFTTKEDLRKALDASSEEQSFGRNQAVALDDIVQCLSSSGTTGSPMYYPVTRNDVEMFADAIAHNWFTAGVRREDVVAHLVGLPIVAGGLPYADGFRRIGATLCWLGGLPTERILREMPRLRVTALLATTSFGLYLAEKWGGAGHEAGQASTLRKVLTGGEPGLGEPEIRERIKRGLAITQLRETMGMGDVIPGMWSECEVQDGMHFNAQRYVAVELIDSETDANIPWREGAAGELVYTTFEREAAPVVRYRSRDHALVIGVNCACGRTSPRIRCIGRMDDMLIYRGMNVFPSSIREHIARSFANEVEPVIRVWKVHADQVRFDDPIAVDVEASPAFDLAHAETLAEAIEKEVRTHLQVCVAVRVLESGGLPKSIYKNALVAVRDSTSSKTKDRGWAGS